MIIFLYYFKTPKYAKSLFYSLYKNWGYKSLRVYTLDDK